MQPKSCTICCVGCPTDRAGQPRTGRGGIYDDDCLPVRNSPDSSHATTEVAHHTRRGHSSSRTSRRSHAHDLDEGDSRRLRPRANDLPRKGINERILAERRWYARLGPPTRVAPRRPGCPSGGGSRVSDPFPARRTSTTSPPRASPRARPRAIADPPSPPRPATPAVRELSSVRHHRGRHHRHGRRPVPRAPRVRG